MQINIGWLYPELMSTYGDRGNIICLQKRCQWRKIKVKIVAIDFNSKADDIKDCDIIIGGGAQDRQQEMVIVDLLKYKAKVLTEMFDNDIPGLFVCGSPQLLGHYYTTADGKKLEGLKIFDFVTKHFGHDKPRCVGNTIGEINTKVVPLQQKQNLIFKKTIVGFENHGGRTYLGKNIPSFAKVFKGSGNNGEDGTEGAVYKNIIACYYHGPFLPKNPHITDYLITKSLEIKYKYQIQLEALDDSLEWKAHNFILKRMRYS